VNIVLTLYVLAVVLCAVIVYAATNKDSE